MESTHVGFQDDLQHVARRLLEAREAQLRCAACPRGDEHREICEALQRLEAGCWGECEACHAAIGRNRLLAVPEARRCVRCRR